MTEKKTVKQNKNNPLWGGRFQSGPDELTIKINSSIAFDKALAEQDIAASRSHCSMLIKTQIIDKNDGKSILAGLDKIESEIFNNTFIFKTELEDIHMNIEGRLTELIGPTAGKLHTARSRNDQVATDLRLWVRKSISNIDNALTLIQRSLLDMAEKNIDTILPGLTHLQPAQPVVFGHHLLAYFEMFSRDKERFSDCSRRLNESPLGSAALAGTAFKIDRDMTSKDLGFDRPMKNSLDAVSSRDFAAEFLSCAAITAIHLSRLGEEITIWASPQFNFISLPDEFSTGSSIMPQKRNPDVAELLRAKSGRIIGNLTGLLVVLKGLPLAYAKDLQEDKESVFDSASQLQLCLEVTANMIPALVVNKDEMRSSAESGYLTATDLADWLVENIKLPFRQAHEITGRIVKIAEKKGCSLSNLSLEELQAVEPSINKEIFLALDVESSINRRTSFGGTSPAKVAEAIKIAKAQIE